MNASSTTRMGVVRTSFVVVRRSEDDGIIYAVVVVLRVVARRGRVRGCVASNTPRTARARGVVHDGTLLTVTKRQNE